MATVTPSHFHVTVKDLRELIEAEKHIGVEMLEKHGGVKGLGQKLHVDVKHGIDPNNSEDMTQRELVFGKNVMPTKPQTSLLELMWAALHDFTLIMLMASAAVSIALGVWQNIEGHGAEWIEGVAILVSVVIVVFVSAGNDYAKEKQFRKLNSQAQDVPVNVIRAGKQQVISIFDLYVGDVVEIAVGDILPADGVLIHGNNLKIDESSLTGESDLILKGHERPFILSNTKTMEGSGSMMVMAVGPNSQAGIIKQLIITGKFNHDGQEKKEDENQEEEEESSSVLQEKLEAMAIFIGKIGTFVAVVAVLVMVIRFVVENANNWKSSYWGDLVKFLITGITILVVAVPEGLPLAVTLSLAFSVGKMLEDNNLVKHLDACETMGSATTICSDKTGTLTTNRMSVMAAWVGDKNMPNQPGLTHVNPTYSQILAESISVNSTGRITKDANGLWDYIGNKTECSLVKFLVECGIDYMKIRENADVAHVHPFSSKRKRMSTIVKVANNDYRIHAKGASEIVLDRCSHYKTEDNTLVSFTEEKKRYVLDHVIESFASQGLRTLCIAYKEFEANETSVFDMTDPDGEPSLEKNLICLGIVGIEDPVRPEVPEAIRICKKAGITVRMVTGDNYTTAISIAKKCGIIEPDMRIDENTALEGPVFRKRVLENGNINQAEFDRIWPHMRVLARSSPADKFTLVTGLLNSTIFPNRQVVAVTGDGTNDAPALKKADVGFAMGIQGTSVAKDACDIILMDDNFTSIVKAVKWGRNVYDSIGKFLQFQLTVNVVAITVAFFGSVIEEESPLGAVQLLWVNLLMDSLASLALATEPPTDELLNRAPYGRDKGIISARMAINILGQSAYQLVVLMTMTFSPSSFNLKNGFGEEQSAHLTVVFNTFVMMQLFNEFNARNLHGEINPFRNIMANKLFIVIWIGTFGVQVLLVFFGGAVFHCKPLNSAQWGMCMAFGFFALIWGMLIQLIPERFIIAIIPSLSDKAHHDSGSGSGDHQRKKSCSSPTKHDATGKPHIQMTLQRGSSRLVQDRELMRMNTKTQMGEKETSMQMNMLE